jgi:hypothetical protein
LRSCPFSGGLFWENNSVSGFVIGLLMLKAVFKMTMPEMCWKVLILKYGWNE